MSFTLLKDKKSYAWQSTNNPSFAFLHGWGRDCSDFEYFYNKIDGIFIDLPGFGKSPEPNRAWSPNDYSIWLNEVLPDSVDTIVAHSFGGRVATHYLNNFNNINRSIMVGVPLLKYSNSQKGEKLELKLLKKANKFNILPDSYVEKYKRKHGSLDYRNSEGLMRDILVSAVNDDMSEILKKLNSPIYLIWGDKDKEVPLRVAQEALGMLNDSRLFVLKDVGHNPFINKSNEVMEIIKDL
ncbi:MAG: alpha/beta hydrolase [Actinomycetota bacterium]|nr:alpha/beta hydrolase [Actinomycetota bacterium]